MRRGGGFPTQTIHQHNHQNHSPHGPHQLHHHQHRPRMFQPPPPPYGPRGVSFPVPPHQPQQHQHHYPPPPLPSAALIQGPVANNTSAASFASPPPPTISLHSSAPSSAVIGGDMPPVETVVARLETACRLLHGIGGNNTRVNEIGVEIQILSEDLRRVGPLLETAYPDVLDRVMSSMRDASAQPSLPPSLRLAIFELVELRASKWLLPSDSSNYYRQRRNINESAEVSVESASMHYPPRAGTVLASKPEIMYHGTSPSMGTSPIPSSNTDSSMSTKTYREEIVIKNSDSGKVMGVRGRRVHIIEAISDTIISFEKVAPTAKERVLSINGYSQQSINMAKHLIQETIQRNSSPVFDGIGASGDFPGIDIDSDLQSKKLGLSKCDDIPRFSYSVTLGEDVVKISGSNLQYVQEAKFALDDFFSQKYPELFSNGANDDNDNDHTDVSTVPKYDRTTLLSLSLVRTQPPDFQHLDEDIRNSIILERPRNFDPEKFCKDMSSGLKLNDSAPNDETISRIT